MADKSKRQGWISPDVSNLDHPLAGYLHGNDTTEEGACDTTHLRVQVPDAVPRQANRPTRSPRALPRRLKMLPPAYDQAQKYRKADGKNVRFSQQTERKFVHHSEDDTESSDEENYQKGLPSALQQLDDEQQTVPKIEYCRTRKETPSGPYEAVDDSLMSKEDQSQLMDTIRHLQDEQESLKSKLREHDLHLISLMDRQPSVRHTLRRKVNNGQTTMDSKMNQTVRTMQMTQEQETSVDNKETDHLYVQIEQLYSNFCKMHLPANSIKWMLKMKQSKQMLHSKDDIDAVQDAFARRENSQGYWDIFSVQESLDLQKENEELKAKVKKLEARLKEKLGRPNPTGIGANSSDISMPTISTMPKLCNVSPSYLINDTSAKSKTNPLIRKKKANEPTSSSEGSIVAGCPVQTHPAMGSVNPVKMKFEWRISNYSKKLEMERKGEQINIESNPFYINHNGYLAQLEVYLNGNSTGQDKCMSVFLRILKGTYDHRLHWPVRLCFVVMLVNQIKGRQESLKGGSNGFSEFEFRKPVGCTNDSSDCWGFVEFISHNMISQRQYICNDSILLGISLKIL